MSFTLPRAVLAPRRPLFKESGLLRIPLRSGPRPEAQSEVKVPTVGRPRMGKAEKHKQSAAMVVSIVTSLSSPSDY